MIAFYNGKTDMLKYTVTLVDGKLIIDGDPEKVLDIPENEIPMFMEQFAKWDNGYSFSITIPDGETAPEKYEYTPVEKKYTAEDIKKGREIYYASKK